MTDQKRLIKSIVVGGLVGGLVYAILMSIFYQVFGEEIFNPKKFAVDFLMFAVIMAGITWWGNRKNTRKNT
ncbi:MAG: hypothetical protein WBA16_09955 [Nonlabens sp.]